MLNASRLASRAALVGRTVAFTSMVSPRRAEPFYYSRYTRTYSKKAKQVELTEADNELVDIASLEGDMQASLNALKWEFTHTVTPRLSPVVVGNLRVSVQDESVEVKDLGQITMPNPQTILINLSGQPKVVQDVVKALQEKVNLSPMVEGSVIKAPLPKPSKEHREELVKLAKAHAVKSKVSARKVREKAISTLRKKKSVSKDSIRRIENKIQAITDKHSVTVDQMVKAKTDELNRG